MTRLSRLLILSASYGDGHQQAARAVEAAVNASSPETDVQILDYLRVVHPTIDWMAKHFYIQSVKYAPLLYDWFYRGTSQIPPTSLIQRQLNSLGMEDLAETLATYRPDAVLATFPTPAGVLSALKQQGRTTVPLTTLVTDHAVHSQWIHAGTDLYFVPSHYVREGLIARGTPPGAIEVTGIPVRPSFQVMPNRPQLLAKYGLDEHVPTLLVMGGAYGVLGDIGILCEEIARCSERLQLLVVTGRNDRLLQQVSMIETEPHIHMQVFGFVREIHELMAVSDLMLTKAGGLTVSEAVALQLPMLLYRPIPGQEIQNSAYLVKSGVARWAKSRDEVVEQVRQLLFNSPETLEIMRKKALSIRRLDAAAVIADRLQALARGNTVYPSSHYATVTAKSSGVAH
ncbi:MAG: glycosyltransferase [Alicyclobacillaceae bacterium]|nr:glycosyltransferase [Alicyclobacillaceae bacterium]